MIADKYEKSPKVLNVWVLQLCCGDSQHHTLILCLREILHQQEGFFLHRAKAIVDYLRHFNALSGRWPSRGDGAQLFSNMCMGQYSCTRLRISAMYFSSV